MNLSKHFTLHELVRSSLATRNGIDNTPSPAVLEMLKRLAVEVLEPIREALGRPVQITSGYRCIALNDMVGGSPGSAHMDGRAADFVVPGMEMHEYAPIVRQACAFLPVGKLIEEFPPKGWLHVQVEPLGRLPRREFLTAERGPKGTIYRVWS